MTYGRGDMICREAIQSFKDDIKQHLTETAYQNTLETLRQYGNDPNPDIQSAHHAILIPLP